MPICFPAFPFERSPLEAQRLVGALASVLCGEKGLQSFAAALLPMLGFEPIKPVRLTPVWFPGWVIDAEVQGDVNIQGAEVCFALLTFDMFSQTDSAHPSASSFCSNIQCVRRFRFNPPQIFSKHGVKCRSYVPGKHNSISTLFYTLIFTFQAQTIKSSPLRPYCRQMPTPENQCPSPKTSFANLISRSFAYHTTYLHSPSSTLLITYRIGKLS